MRFLFNGGTLVTKEIKDRDRLRTLERAAMGVKVTIGKIDLNRFNNLLTPF